MTDPLKLAEEIEARLRYDGGQYWPTLSPEDARTVAAALRLAEALNERDSLVAANPLDAIEDRGGWASRIAGLIAAYRAAREGR